MRIHFQDQGQDFLHWDLDSNGVVVDCGPFQATQWCGVRVLRHAELQVGDGVVYRRDEKYTNSIRYPIVQIEPSPTADEWNAKHPVGTPCRYYPVAGDADHIKTRTRSEAWALGHGAVVVKVEGKTGGVDIHHLVMEG